MSANQTARKKSVSTRKRSSIYNRRLLILAPFAPRMDAAHGGGRVIAHLVRQLGKKHRVGLCYLRAPGEPSADEMVQERTEIIEEVALPYSGSEDRLPLSARLKVLSDLLGGKPLWAAGRWSPDFAARLRGLVQSWQPHLIQLEYHIMGQYLPALAGVSAPRILVLHEPGIDAASQLLRSGQAPGRFMPYLDLLAWKRFEPGVMRQVDAVVVFTERDRLSLSQSGPATPVVCIPPGVHLPPQPLDPLGSWPLNLLFIGNYHHPPNVDAAIRLTDQIFPKVRVEIPDARLIIVGSHPPPELRQRAGEYVIVTGQVPDVRPYLDRASLVVAPLRLGGGMRVKVMEALAAGKALVATSLAVEGLELVDGKHVLLAESDQAFAQAVITLLAEPEHRRSLAGQARLWACDHLGWDTAVARYEALYESFGTT